MSQLRRKILLIVFMAIIGHNRLFAGTDVKIKVLAINPSSSQVLETEVKQYLPPEVKPEDILEKADMQIQYDSDRKSYFVIKKVQLQPQETKTLEIRIKDVWAVSPDDMEAAKTQLAQSFESLKNTKFSETAKLLYDKASEALNRIDEEEKMELPIKQRIELYRAHVKQLEDIRNNIFSIGSMNKLKEEKDGTVKELKYMISAENPSAEQVKMKVRSPLPKEIGVDDVLNKLDFMVLYDDASSRYVLEKEEILAGKETKKYIITLRDIWYIPQTELDFLKEQTEKLSGLFKGSSYEGFAKQRSDYIFTTLEEVNQLQSEVESSTALEDHMRAFVLNSQRVDLVKKKMRELQDLLPELNLKHDESSVFGKMSILFIKKLLETKNLVLVAMGIQPDRPVIWWIIGGIILFLAVFSSVFYMVWLKKLQESKWGKPAVTESPVPVAAPQPPQEKAA